MSWVHSSSEPVHQWIAVRLGELGDLVDPGEDALVRGRLVVGDLLTVSAVIAYRSLSRVPAPVVTGPPPGRWWVVELLFS